MRVLMKENSHCYLHDVLLIVLLNDPTYWFSTTQRTIVSKQQSLPRASFVAWIIPLRHHKDRIGIKYVKNSQILLKKCLYQKRWENGVLQAETFNVVVETELLEFLQKSIRTPAKLRCAMTHRCLGYQKIVFWKIADAVFGTAFKFFRHLCVSPQDLRPGLIEV